ncbi:MAG: signal peptidase II [Chloroflexi bacterium]|nr:MAG: signal peptidase II [Chloroflexota bacterium]PIE81719.1 MAG: signal peptidase II [Chloroflexota bacterium]
MIEQDNQTLKPNEQKASGKRLILVFFVAFVVILLDQATKRFIEANVVYNTSWMPLEWLAPYFQITHIGNTGIAFGLFSGGSVVFALISILVTGAIVYFAYTLPAEQTALRIVFGVVLGGAIGNLIDRLRQGYVTDFLDFGPWPVFNVADMAVVFGAVALAILMFYEERQYKKAEEASLRNNPPADELTDEQQPAN